MSRTATSKDKSDQSVHPLTPQESLDVQTLLSRSLLSSYNVYSSRLVAGWVRRECLLIFKYQAIAKLRPTEVDGVVRVVRVEKKCSKHEYLTVL